MKLFPQTLFLLFIIIQTHSCTGENNEARAGQLVLFAQGLTNPVSITHAGDNRLYVAEQAGTIRIVDAQGNVKPQVFLDIRGKVRSGGEQGLLGLAFHPSYSTNGYFYVNYTGSNDSTFISRFKVNSSNPDLADPLSELILMRIFQPYTNHNGGNLAFGPDGYLYIGLGDGGSSGDPGNRAQNPMTMLGKMLRIDVNSGTKYGIPSNNPFANSTTVLREIWSFGLRNPWKYSFDRLTGDLWIADVGQNQIEEINFQPAASSGGENYGWRCYEGNQVYNSAGCSGATSYVFPVYTYSHGSGCSVTGGYVYRGNPSSAYYGYYFFADYCSNWIWSLHQSGNTWMKEDFGQFPGNNFSTFGEDRNGQLYVAGQSGKIYLLNLSSTSVSQHSGELPVKIIQLPHSSRIRIEMIQKPLSDMKVTLRDIKGSVLYEGFSRETIFEFDPGFRPPGAYILNLTDAGRNSVYKIISGDF